jgi:hypothetical protein
MASPDDDPPHDDPAPPPGVDADDMRDHILESLLEENVFFDDDGNPVGDELDESYDITGRGHCESIDFYDSSGDDGSSDGGSADAGSNDGGSTDAGSNDGGSADGGEDKPLYHYGSADVWGAPVTTDDPAQDAADVSAGGGGASGGGASGGQSGDPGAGS